MDQADDGTVRARRDDHRRARQRDYERTGIRSHRELRSHHAGCGPPPFHCERCLTGAIAEDRRVAEKLWLQATRHRVGLRLGGSSAACRGGATAGEGPVKR